MKTIFADFASLWPERFTNMTNGVTPRRWLAQANPGLAALLDGTHRRRLAARPRPAARAASRTPTTPAFRDALRRASSAPTRSGWPRYVERELGIALDPASLFDVQVKRIHEYKRQLLNLLHVITRYQAIAAPTRSADWVPRTRDLRRQGGVGVPRWPSRSSG